MEKSDPSGKDELILESMHPQSQVWVSTEDWTGVTSARQRRKLQNRLNQRAWRSRQKLKQNSQATTTPDSEGNGKPPDLSTKAPIIAEDSATPSKERSSDCGRSETTLPTKNRLVCRMGHAERRDLVEQLARQAWYERQAGAPCFVHLAALTKINVFRALSSNAEILGCSSEWLEHDAVSRFQVRGDSSAGGQVSVFAESAKWPSALRPKGLQKTESHHPWIDLLPLARMRENLLEALHYPGLVDEDALCYDIVDVGFEGGPDEPSLVVWGQPWDPCGWEVSVAFLRKWGWLLRGCEELLNSTNYWRRLRGEKPLAFGTLARSGRT